MPFSSSPVYVNNGDNIQIRYVTPDFWNETVTVNVQIGTGTDPDGITFGTKIPDATPQTFSFTNQSGFTGAFTGTSTPGGTNTFQRNTYYYSQVVDISDIEVPIPASISAVDNGPKNSSTANSTAQFRIYRNGGFDSWRTSITANYTDGTGGLRPGDKVQLRVKVADWYTTSTTVTFNVSDETWGTNIGHPAASFSRTWSITTRAQDFAISQFQYVDRVDEKSVNDGNSQYKEQDIPITNIDGDVVLRASSSGNVQIRKNGSGSWVQNLTNIVLNDTVNTRISVGTGNTTKTTGTATVFAVDGDTYTAGGVVYENNTTGTYGGNDSYGNYTVVQSSGSVTDNWSLWTEVDRYPAEISAVPIFTYNISTTLTSTGAGFTFGVIYDVTGGSGSGMKVKAPVGSTDNFTDFIIVDPGYGYQAGNTLTVPSPVSNGVDASFTLDEYQKINVSGTATNSKAEAGFMYFADFTVGSLGQEYPSGSYNDLAAPYQGTSENITNIQNKANTLNSSNVIMNAIIDGTGGQIRKNNTGSWVQQLAVQNGDVINLKLNSNEQFGTSVIATVKLQGPPLGNPSVGNPTLGPSSPTYPDRSTTMLLQTRAARSTPFPFHAQPVFLSNPGQEHIAEVKIRGLDVPTIAFINSGIGTLSRDGTNWSSNITLQPTDYTLYVRQSASVNSGDLKQLTYTVGTAVDTFKITTEQFDPVTGDTFNSSAYFGSDTGGSTGNFLEIDIPAYGAQLLYLTLIGAGGGYGGDDAPNSEGGPGGNGNIFRGILNIPENAWPAGGEYKLRVYPPNPGEDGENYVQGSGGGEGGFGYCYGGSGGNSGPSDKSGGGGGGGGAAAITFTNNVLIAMAGGGGGGAGAGGDTTIPDPEQYGNHNGNGPISTSTVNLNQPGDNAPNAGGEGGGPGGGGGGYDGTAGVLLSQKLDPDGNVIQNFDLDGTGGSGGGVFYNNSYVTPISVAAPSGQGSPCGQAGAVIFEFPQQDISPNPYSFSQVDDALINSQVESNITQITGITGSVSVQLSNPGFTTEARVCTSTDPASCGPYGVSSVSNGEFLQLRATLGSIYNATYRTNVLVGDIPANWDVLTGPPPDTEPAPYFFTDVLNVLPPGTMVASETITISGITVPVTITATNGAEVRVDGGAWVLGTSNAQISNGQTLQVRIASSTNFTSTVTTSITVGDGDSVDWSVSTGVEQDSEPNAFTWIAVTGGDLEREYESNTIIIKGIDTVADFIVESGFGDSSPQGNLPQIKKNNAIVPNATQISVENFDTISLVYTTSDVVGDARVFNTKTGLASSSAGFYETEWYVATSGQFGSDPDPFSFSTVIAAGEQVYTESVETHTISGLANGLSVVLFGTNNLEVSINGGAYNQYPLSSPASVSNGTTIRVRLLSSAIPGFTRSAQIYVGSFNTIYNVQTPASVQDPVLGQWYSSITPVKYVGNSQIRYSTKFDGLPVGGMMPVFQDATQSDNWGLLNGALNSRFHGFLYCNGDYYDPADYPCLFDVIGYDYGAKTVGPDTYFRVPDMRNRYLKGTGVIDGSSLSSPGLTPEYNRAKNAGSPGNNQAGAFGGYWFVNDLGDPSVGEIDQVEEPAFGQPATTSDFFGIATIITEGYTNVTGNIEFETYGSIDCPVSLKTEKIYDVPLHFHDLITGIADPGRFKGRINWGGQGGYSQSVEVGSNNIGSPNNATFNSSTTIAFNLWGYHTDNYVLSDEHLPPSKWCSGSDVAWWDGGTDNWGSGTNPGYEGVNSVDTYNNVTVTQDNIKSGGTNFNEIDDYIDLSSQPFSGNTGTAGGEGDALKFVTTVDIPSKEVTVKSFSPIQKLKHSHYLSLLDPTSVDNVYGYGNNETGGTASNALNTFVGGINNSVDVNFTALGVGIQVLPGTFTLSASKQLVPQASLNPQTDVPLVTPYTWTKWLIKAF